MDSTECPIASYGLAHTQALQPCPPSPVLGTSSCNRAQLHIVLWFNHGNLLTSRSSHTQRPPARPPA